jgi:hypothetical protein
VCLIVYIIEKPQYRGGQGSSMCCSSIGEKSTIFCLVTEKASLNKLPKNDMNEVTGDRPTER